MATPLYIYLHRGEGLDFCLRQIEMARDRSMKMAPEWRPTVAVLTVEDYEWLDGVAALEIDQDGVCTPQMASALETARELLAPLELVKADPEHATTEACTFETSVSIRGIGSGGSGLGVFDFNRAWGFEDGACNEWVADELVAKPAPRDYSEAYRIASMGHTIRIEVTVMKDGSVSARVVK